MLLCFHTIKIIAAVFKFNEIWNILRSPWARKWFDALFSSDIAVCSCYFCYSLWISAEYAGDEHVFCLEKSDFPPLPALMHNSTQMQMPWSSMSCSSIDFYFILFAFCFDWAFIVFAFLSFCRSFRKSRLALSKQFDAIIFIRFKPPFSLFSLSSLISDQWRIRFFCCGYSEDFFKNELSESTKLSYRLSSSFCSRLSFLI